MKLGDKSISVFRSTEAIWEHSYRISIILASFGQPVLVVCFHGDVINNYWWWETIWSPAVKSLYIRTSWVCLYVLSSSCLLTVRPRLRDASQLVCQSVFNPVSDGEEARGIHHNRTAAAHRSSERKTNRPARLTNVCQPHVRPLAVHQAHSKRRVCRIESAPVVSLMCSINKA